MPPQPFNALEQEILVLKAVWDCIAEMVNYEIFLKPDQTTDVSMMPDTATHQRLFNILLDDFLSAPDANAFDLPKPPKDCVSTDKTYLFYLKNVIAAPKLNPEGADHLKGPVQNFVDWLEADCTVEKVWFPSISVETNLTVKRIAFIRICGSIARHNFGRLTRNANELVAILKQNGVVVDDDQRFLILPEFYEWFHDSILNYHISALAEFLNNIRWGIYEYLYSEWCRSYTRDPIPKFPERYKYIFPRDCQRPLAR
jgi:hypothetical protein